MTQILSHNKARNRAQGRVVRKTRRGVSMLEFIGVLVVSIIVLATGIALLDHLDNRRRMSQAIGGYQLLAHKIDQMDLRTIDQLSSAVSTRFQSGPVGLLVGGGNFVPPGFSYDVSGTTSTFRDPFGNPITVGYGTGQLNSAATPPVVSNWSHLELQVEEIAGDVCAQLATELNWANNSRLVTIEIEPSSGTATTFARATGAFLSPVTSTNTFPIEAADITSSVCSLNGNTIRWRFVKAPV